MGVGKAREVLVSSTAHDAVVGSGFEFADHGVHRLKGIEGEWRLHDLVAIDGVRRSLPLGADEARRRRAFVEGAPITRRRERFVAAGIGAAIVALLAVGWLSGAIGGSSPTDDRSVGPDPSLLTVVPERLRPSCVPSSSSPPGASASVDCTEGDAYAVTYSRFASADDLAAAFETFASSVDQTETDCARAPSARGEYTVNGVPDGHVACYLDEGTSAGSTRSVIVWTADDLGVLGRALRTDSADLTLYGWWRTQTGPWSGEASPPKDGEPRRRIEGTFAADGLTLTFEGGRYHESAFSVYGDSAILYGKPSRLLLFHETPAPSGARVCPRYEVYRYRLEGSALSLRLLEGGCREYASTDIDGQTFTRLG